MGSGGNSASDAGAANAPNAVGGQYIGSCRPDCGPRGGSGGTGGSQQPPNVDLVLPSSGCGRPFPTEQVAATVPGLPSDYRVFSVSQTGASLGAAQPEHARSRKFYVRVPFTYDATRPLRVVYVNPNCGASSAATGPGDFFPLEQESIGGDQEAIYIVTTAPDEDKDVPCYDTKTGPISQEWEAFDLMQSFVESHFCVDNNRIFVTGVAAGGWLANMWACYFGAAGAERKFSPKWSVRGRVVLDGGLATEQPLPCNGPSAGLWLHGINDVPRPIENDIAALELALTTNGCTGNYVAGPKEPWAAAEGIPHMGGGICQRYTGCPSDIAAQYPLIFCTNPAPLRGVPSSVAALVTAFTAEMAPKL